MDLRTACNDYDRIKRAVLGQRNPDGSQYVWFDSPYDLNLVIVRSNTPGATGRSSQARDRYDDYLCVAYVDNRGRGVVEVFLCTSETGLKYLRRKLGRIKLGGKWVGRTAIYLPQQVRGLWDFNTSRGHKGYRAGRQVRAARFAADIDADKYLNLNYTVKRDGSIEILDPRLVFKGNILANLHRASKSRVLKRILGYSAACVVVPDIRDFRRLLQLVDRQIKAGFGSRCTGTILTRQAVTSVK